jgi:hypothetical protein
LSSIKRKGKIIKTNIQLLKKIYKNQVRDFKYLFNGIDMSSRYLYSVASKNKKDKEVAQE